MKLIFIDIDGVMNSAMGKEPYMADMEVSKLKLLKSIIDDNGAFGIVLNIIWLFWEVLRLVMIIASRSSRR